MDRFVMQVEKDGVKVKVHYVVKVLEDWEADKGVCEPEIRKISQPSAEASRDLAPWMRSTSLSALLAGASHSLSGFADLFRRRVG